ncbi:MAG: hypothetical protein HOI47_02700 [Candidatus Scalindua sp.]|nr:hypothetical protein [Candidatus Scalindua sp.]
MILQPHNHPQEATNPGGVDKKGEKHVRSMKVDKYQKKSIIPEIRQKEGGKMERMRLYNTANKKVTTVGQVVVVESVWRLFTG